MYDNTIDSPVCVEVDGAVVQFPRLTLGVLAELAAKWHAEDDAALRKLLIETQATPDRALTERRALAEQASDSSYVYACISRRARAMEVMARSLQLAGRTSSEATVYVSSLRLGYPQLVELGLAIAGIVPKGDGRPTDPKAFQG